jgi:hypothetical protein
MGLKQASFDSGSRYILSLSLDHLFDPEEVYPERSSFNI